MNGRRMKLIAKLRGDGAVRPPRPDISAIAKASVGSLLAISVVGLASTGMQAALVLGSFGASCLLVFGYPDLPFSQPRNAVFGHILSSFIGLSFLAVLGPHWWAMALATATAVALMMATRTTHPPAGSNPVIVFLTQPGWGFLLFPTAVGVVVLLLTALIYNNVAREPRYPKYW
jgi:CBS-domain-containing membrane protein